ncbi:hypothetical protein L1987_48511 [Smallanthus sonchifolius]|uniref:Uncharacterized protein n=1 Tax=Smallanthus sonchifolius TaxID=185202 RepID=A0ACB9FT29_9ASTR|nr:hypothetical protein L1987_48511 [Smallanthus sonchifolius]
MAPARSALQDNTGEVKKYRHKPPGLAKILAMHGRALDCPGVQSSLFFHVRNLAVQESTGRSFGICTAVHGNARPSIALKLSLLTF